jgi:bifunctional DNA-binding transcriptional regulator/antitoxin component of YhaV-PrlF toxin-antitoxin module
MPPSAWLRWTFSSKGQLVIPARRGQLLGLNPGDRWGLTLEAVGQPLATDLRMSYLSEDLMLRFQKMEVGKLGSNSFHPPWEGL